MQNAASFKPAQGSITGVLASNLCDECKVKPMFGVFPSLGGDRKLCISCKRMREEGEIVDHSGSRAISNVVSLPLVDAKNLTDVLSRVLDGLLAGTISVEKARTVCQISSEAVKVLDLMWRMNRK